MSFWSSVAHFFETFLFSSSSSSVFSSQLCFLILFYTFTHNYSLNSTQFIFTSMFFYPLTTGGGSRTLDPWMQIFSSYKILIFYFYKKSLHIFITPRLRKWFMGHVNHCPRGTSYFHKIEHSTFHHFPIQSFYISFS